MKQQTDDLVFWALRFGLLLICLLGLSLPTALLAFDAPWDQGHETTDDEDPEEEGPPPGPDDCSGNNTSSPVYTASGDLIWHETDIEIQGRMPLTLRRNYNSHDPRDGMFGKGWTANCEPSLIKVYTPSGSTASARATGSLPDGVYPAYILREGSGKRHIYTWSEDRSSINPPKWRLDKIEPQGDGSSKLINLDGSYRLFDAQGRLQQSIDRNGNSLSYNRDEAGRLTRKTDGHGRYLDFAYDSTGHVVSVTDHSGRSWQYTYSAEGGLTNVTDPLNGTRQYSYQANEMVDYGFPYPDLGTGISSRAGGAVPPQGVIHNYLQLTQVTDESGVVELSVNYESGDNNTGRRVESYTEGSNTNSYSYPAATARVTNTLSKEDSASSSWQYTYDETDGQITEKTGPGHYKEQWVYDDHSLIKQYTDQTGSVWNILNDDLGRKLSSTDPLGQETKWEYTADKPWPIKITSPSGRVTAIEYDANGNPQKITDASGAITQMEYNATGDLTALIDATGNRSEISYTAAGLPSQYKDPLGRITLLEYDPLGRLIKTTNPAGETSQIAYDKLDRINTQTDGLNQITSFRYDAASRLSKVTDASQNDIGVFSYDSHGRMQTATEAGISYSYSYNPNNTLATLTQGDVTTTYSYDKRRLRTGQSTADISISTSYDKNRRLLSISGNGATVRYQYDAAGQITQERTASRSIDLSYNSESELTAYTTGDNSYQLQRDSRGQLTKLITPAGEYPLTHDPRGLLTQIQLPNGKQHSQSYDAAGQLSTQDYSQSGGQTYGYQYDPAGRLTQASGEQSRQYSYDDASRLTGASHDSENYNYSYDPVGNRTENSQSHDAANRLNEDAEHSYEYDNRGNLIKKTNKTSGEHSDYRYNSLNQLETLEHYPDATSTTADTTASYTYDAIGRRYQKTVNGILTAYLWLGSQLIAEYQSNQLSKSYSYAEGYAPIEVSDGTNTWTVHSDHLDTPRYLTDQNGQIVWTNLPSPFGISVVNEDPDGDGNIITFNFRFPGQYYDSESGLHYNFFRYYDPATGRYITSDPIGLDSDFNTYGYVGGNPLYWVDPEGLGKRGNRGSSPYPNARFGNPYGDYVLQNNPNWRQSRDPRHPNWQSPKHTEPAPGSGGRLPPGPNRPDIINEHLNREPWNFKNPITDKTGPPDWRDHWERPPLDPNKPAQCPG